MNPVIHSPVESPMRDPLLSAVLFAEGLELGLFTVEGEDAEDFLHRQLSNEIRHLAPGSGAPVCLLNREGRITLFFTLWRTETGYSAVVPEQQRSQFIPLLDRVLFRERVRLADQTPISSPLILAGDQAESILMKAGAREVPVATFRSFEFPCEGTSVKVYGMDWLLSPCFLLVAPAVQGDAVRERLEAAGSVLSSLDSFHSYRVEKGSPWPGFEVDESMIPYECGLEHTASLTKGCYVGQEIISRIHNLGKPPRVLRGLVLEGQVAPERGASVHFEKVEVGRVLSSAWSGNLGRPIATTSIRVKYSADGTAVSVGGQAATVREFPLVRRSSS